MKSGEAISRIFQSLLFLILRMKFLMVINPSLNNYICVFVKLTVAIVWGRILNMAVRTEGFAL